MHRFVFLLVALAASGCASVHSIYPDRAGELELLHERARGKEATLHLTDGSRRSGTIAFVRADSVAWTSGADRFAVPTADVARVARHRQTRPLRDGMLIGAGAAVFVLGGGHGVVWGTWETAVLSSAVFLGLGTALGLVESRRRIYVLRR
jgi:hypothetical protein